jgi:hypothetical protein
MKGSSSRGSRLTSTHPWKCTSCGLWHYWKPKKPQGKPGNPDRLEEVLGKMYRKGCPAIEDGPLSF